MENLISRMMGDYESGRVSRRELVGRLGAMMAGVAGVAGLGGQAMAAHHEGHTFEGTSLNHIALRVTDVGRSRDFYVKHLGLKVSRESANNCFLTCGDNFVALFKNVLSSRIPKESDMIIDELVKVQRWRWIHGLIVWSS